MTIRQCTQYIPGIRNWLWKCVFKGSERIVTDSGGIQREAFFAGVPCVTILDYIVWPETMAGKRNQLAKPYKEDIIQKLRVTPEQDNTYQPFGDGRSVNKIISAIDEFLEFKA